ncbi:MAG TPA: tripartite tricarboxylate transporter substrate binding protein [Xanthobacteraceae bacterium]|nr:tripartite tricarboxylate transporter substrate binding protein [Xanthobacteraceae bacterium]
MVGQMCIRVSFAAALAVGLLGSYQAAAQDWPTRPLTLVVPFSPGGGVDASARVQAQRMSEILGQPIVVENIGAAAGMAGGQRVATAAPDGYTFLVGNTGTHAYNQSLYKKPLYNAASDFQPVGLMTESPRILIARKDLPVNNLQEFVAYAKQNQTKMQYGSAGVGSGTHLPCALLNMAMGVDITHIPYRGAGPVMQDLIGGRLDYMCDTIQTGAAQANSNTVKGIAVMSAKRVPIIPDVPTTGEQGLPGVEATVWNAFFLPKGTPEPIVRKLNQAMRETLEDPVIRKRLENFGLEIVPPEQRTPEYLAKFLPEEIARWGKVIKAAGISAD